MGSNGPVLAGAVDADGEPADPGGATSAFFEHAVVFAYVEPDWDGAWDDRFTEEITLTVWSADKREALEVAAGSGAALLARWRVAGQFIPFALIGFADGGGALFEQSTSIGFGYNTGRGEDRTGLGVNRGQHNRDSFGEDFDRRFSPRPRARLMW